MLYVEALSAIPFAAGTLLLPIGLGCVGFALYGFPITRRPAVIVGTVLLVLAVHGVVLMILGVQNHGAFGNRESTFYALFTIVVFLTIGFVVSGIWMIRRST